MELNQTFRKPVLEQRFEFLLYINGNIICQRYFPILGFNEDVVNSMELKWTVDECKRIIQEDLKAKAKDYLWEFFNPYKIQLEEEVPKGDVYEKEDIFGFEIRIDKKTVVKTEFTGNLYPPKVRYQVDIKSMIPSIISAIRDGFTQKAYTENYGDLELAYIYNMEEKLQEWARR